MLHRSEDRKTTPLANFRGVARISNSFPLRSGAPALGGTCVGATAACNLIDGETPGELNGSRRGACYAANIESFRKHVRVPYDRNRAELQEALDGGGPSAAAALIVEMIDKFRAECDKHSAKKVFRIHSNGDFFSVPYAQAWAEAIAARPDVRFWAYTRSFRPTCDVVPALAHLENLSLYLSVDVDNAKWARDVVAQFPRVRLSSFAPAVSDAQDLILEVRGGDGAATPIPCPEALGKVPLVTPDGPGACALCGLCVFGRKDVAFAQHK